MIQSQPLASASIFAIALKVLVAWKFRHHITKASPYLIGALLGLLGMNSVEFVGLLHLHAPESKIAHGSVITYYLFVHMFLSCLLGLSISISRPLKQWEAKALIAQFSMIAIVVCWPGLGIAGIKSIGYSLTRIPGPAYPAIPLSIFITTTSIVAIMWTTATKGEFEDLRRCARVLFASFTPLIIAIFTILALMTLGMPVNATVTLSIASIFTTLLLVKSASRQGQISILRLIPNSRENLAHRAVAGLIENPEFGLKMATEHLEKAMIQEALTTCRGSVPRAAEMLGIDRSTFYRKLKAYDIDTKPSA